MQIMTNINIYVYFKAPLFFQFAIFFKILHSFRVELADEQSCFGTG